MESNKLSSQKDGLYSQVHEGFKMSPEITDYVSDLEGNLRVAVVGFGKMGLLHSAIISLLRAGSLKAVVDKNRLLCLAASKLMKNVAFFKELDEMLMKQEPDIVYVTTPTTSHFHILSKLIEHGVKYIFVEKPPTVDLKQLLEVIEILGRDQIVMSGLQKRYALTFRHAKLMLDSHIIGEPEKVFSSIRSNDINKRTTRFDSLGRGVLLDLGIHLVDLLVWILRAEEVLEASKKNLHTCVDDVFEAVLRTTNGAIVDFEASWSSPNYRLPETRIEIHGSNGILTVTEDFVKVSTRKDKPLRLARDSCLYRPHYYRSTPPVNIADPEYTLENLHFLYCIKNTLEPLTSPRNIEETMRIIDKLYSKASGGEHV